MENALPHTIRQINDLPLEEKREVYRQLIPPWAYERFHIDPATLLQGEQEVVHLRCPTGSRAMELSVLHHPQAVDPTLYLNMVDTFTNQLMVLLVVINDPDAPRFNIDIDENGEATYFGTRTRNLSEEIRAMEAGLAPGQVRQGLRSFKNSIPLFEDFVHRMGHALFLIEPLSYHNAIVFERYGFAYTYGRREMERIHQEFLPGGEYHERLDNSNPFRQTTAWNTARGRSWAIHDGIMGHPFTGFQMYKRIGEHAGITTFPDFIW